MNTEKVKQDALNIFNMMNNSKDNKILEEYRRDIKLEDIEECLSKTYMECDTVGEVFKKAIIEATKDNFCPGVPK